MPKLKMTKANIRDLTVSEGRRQEEYFDIVMPGLVLKVNYGGSRTWFAIHYDDQKKNRWFKLGRYDDRGADELPTPESGQEWPRDLSLQGARQAARLFFQNKELYLRSPLSLNARVSAQWVFEAVVEKYIERRAVKLRSKREIERTLNKYVIPEWKGRKVASIACGDGKELHEKIAEAHGPRQADAVIANVRAVLKWVEDFESYYVCPVRAHRSDNDGMERDGRERALGADEIRLVWCAASQLGSFGAFVKLLLLTAQRREKVARMKWSEINDNLWTIPKELREKANAGILKLPRLALDIIDAQPHIAGNPFVFAGRLDGKPINGFSKPKLELDALLPDDFEHWTLHDLRRTARSVMTDLGISERIAEQVLGHKIKGVERIYNRSQYIEQKGTALLALANYVSQVIAPTPNVIALVERRAPATLA
ncbi:tyrosine-type recombinase/integrase [Bradyrhizobium monzae]|uniref:tyrosine-type recombinase/integrase n=1 Tax=Bradyrhizobium sp. Oc8 TaxID=2876780 RepID=UPI001F2D8FD1|nr:site-specific integrase [Bradyrhizobium sp. Oc8]